MEVINKSTSKSTNKKWNIKVQIKENNPFNSV